MVKDYVTIVSGDILLELEARCCLEITFEMSLSAVAIIFRVSLTVKLNFNSFFTDLQTITKTFDESFQNCYTVFKYYTTLPDHIQTYFTQIISNDSLIFQIFMHKSAMQMHARELTGRSEVKPHQCQQCLKSFSSNHQLVQHIRVHTGEKPYKCSYCDRRFKQLSHVQQHTRLHTGKWHLMYCFKTPIVCIFKKKQNSPFQKSTLILTNGKLCVSNLFLQLLLLWVLDLLALLKHLFNFFRTLHWKIFAIEASLG